MDIDNNVRDSSMNSLVGNDVVSSLLSSLEEKKNVVHDLARAHQALVDAQVAYADVYKRCVASGWSEQDLVKAGCQSPVAKKVKSRRKSSRTKESVVG